jgi:RNA polymerase sigma factor (sigma-70 family)
MSALPLTRVVRQLRGVLATREHAEQTDVDLWQRYICQRDEAAFEALVRRHGPMVLGVCRRILRNEQDAEDAFQATFVVLVRRAASLRLPGKLASWLHGVARRTALEARSAAARRRDKEAAVAPREVTPDDPWVELRLVLDQELGRLREKYRIAVVLCDLEGKTRKEVARQLSWAEGTVASRLARGRHMLARRLARRGYAGVVVAAALAGNAASASVPANLLAATIMAALPIGYSELRPDKVTALTEGVLKSMFRDKLKRAIAAALIVGLSIVGAGAVISWSRAMEAAAAQAGSPDQPQTKQENLHDRVQELKKQLEQMEKKIAALERETRGQDGSKDRDAFLASQFKYKVQFEIGYTETNDGGRIEIKEVWGTRPRIEVGGQYLVRGRYVLPPGKTGKIYFYETAQGGWSQATATMDLQMVEVEKEKGEFTLMHSMAGPGYFHLYLAAPENYSHAFANVYFGTGDSVLRKRP